MTNDVQTRNLLALLRAGAFATDEQIEPMSPWKWRNTFDMACQQGVGGTTGMGVRRLKDQFFLQLPSDLKDRWVAAQDDMGPTTNGEHDGKAPADHDVRLNNPLRQRTLMRILTDAEDETSLALLKNLIRTQRHLIDKGPFLRPLTLLALNVRNGQWVDYDTIRQWIEQLHLQRPSQFIAMLLVELLHIDKESISFADFNQIKEVKHHSRFFKYAPMESLATQWVSFVDSLKNVEE